MQTFVAVAVPFIDGSFTTQIDLETLKITGGPSLVRTYQLWSNCNKRLVQMGFKRKINAVLKDESNPMTRLKFVSDSTGSGRIWIKGTTLKKFLCFSRNGKLIDRVHGNSLRCMFNEVPFNHDIMLQSVANPKWYVGFNNRGKKVKGYEKNDRWSTNKCFTFLKKEWNPDFKFGEQFKDAQFVKSVSVSIERRGSFSSR